MLAQSHLTVITLFVTAILRHARRKRQKQPRCAMTFTGSISLCYCSVIEVHSRAGQKGHQERAAFRYQRVLFALDQRRAELSERRRNRTIFRSTRSVALSPDRSRLMREGQ